MERIPKGTSDVPPCEPPRKVDSVRMEALRAAASVHRGQGSDSQTVLTPADRFDDWLQKR